MIKNDGGSAKNIARDVDAAKRSAGEDAMAVLLTEMGLTYTRQYAYAPPRKLRADFLVTLSGAANFSSNHDDEVLIEIQGGVFPFKRHRKDGTEVTLPGAHGSVSGIKSDNDRLNEATLAGYRMLRFLPEQVKDGTARLVLERLSATHVLNTNGPL